MNNLKPRSLVLLTLLFAVLCLLPNGALAQAKPPVTLPPAANVSASAPDTFVELTFSDIDTLDPALAYDTRSFHVIRQIYETLVKLDPTDSSHIVPALAKGWQISADGLTYTFDVRQGTRFHDGSLLYAHDVAYTIQRGLLQSSPSSPQWTLITPIMGYRSGDITQEIAGGAYAGNPEGLRANAAEAELLATCNKVKAAVTADDATGRVTIRLAAPRGDFLAVLAQYAYILDYEWAEGQGAWDGDCATWQDYYAPETEDSTLTTAVNGTGPYQLDWWQPGVSINLLRFPRYWRPFPAAPVNIERVQIKIVSASQHQAQLLSGQADMVSSFILDVDEHILFTHDRANNWQPALAHPTGSLRAYSGIYSPSATDAFFVFNIDPASPFIGSGALDGNGIPPNFFSDVHVRKAFNYAFNFAGYKTFLESVTGNRAVQRTGPIIKDLPGHKDGQPVYSYNPTLAMQEMQLAWGGQVATNGFHLTLAYGQNNSVQRTIAETIKAGIEGLNPKFHVNVIEISVSEYLIATRMGHMPLFVSSWIHDYAHPYNWLYPYLAGTMASRQAFPADLLAKYQGKVAACLRLMGTPARACYEDIQVSAYGDAPGIYLFQQTATEYVRAEVGGFEDSGLNFAGFGAPDFFSLWKGGAPTSSNITPDAPATLEASSASGSGVGLTIPAGAVVETRRLVVIPDVIPANRTIATASRAVMAAYRLSKFAFQVTAYDNTGQAMNDLTFLQPATLTVRYTPQVIVPLVEDTLLIRRWDGSSWVDAACGPIQRNPAANTLVVPVCSTGLFAMSGTANDVFLPFALWR